MREFVDEHRDHHAEFPSPSLKSVYHQHGPKMVHYNATLHTIPQKDKSEPMFILEILRLSGDVYQTRRIMGDLFMGLVRTGVMFSCSVDPKPRPSLEPHMIIDPETRKTMLSFVDSEFYESKLDGWVLIASLWDQFPFEPELAKRTVIDSLNKDKTAPSPFLHPIASLWEHWGFIPPELDFSRVTTWPASLEFARRKIETIQHHRNNLGTNKTLDE